MLRTVTVVQQAMTELKRAVTQGARAMDITKLSSFIME
jgi:hypothetical protein